MTFRSTFRYQALPMRVIFEIGAVAKVGEELNHLGLDRALILCTPEQRHLAELVAGHLGDRSAGIFDQARMHVPVETADQARAQARDLGADSCVVIGGGSSIGLGKAIALEYELPIVAIPTTYAGSEMTPIWGLTRNGRKQTGRDPRVLPQSVIYDPALTTTLPAEMSAASGLNAVAHAVESLYAPDTSPIISLMAEEGIRAFTTSLRGIVADEDDLDTRALALYGAWLCGACLGATTMSLHHKLCHALGGTLDLPHAQTHAIVLPYVLAYNETHAPAARTALQRALATNEDPHVALWNLLQQLKLPRSLGELGVRADQLPAVITEVLSNPYSNPAPVTENGLRHVLNQALRGEQPTHP